MNDAMRGERRPMAVTVHQGGPLVVCDDGTSWWWCPELGIWTEYDAIPGTAAALASSEGGDRATDGEGVQGG